MTDFMTRLALVGAAVSFAAWVFLVNKGRIARVSEFISRIPRSSLSVFLAFAIVATGVAQKGGTNAPPNGASPPQMMGMLPQGLQPLNLPGDDGAVSVTSDDVARGFLIESVVTNETYSYAMPTNGTRYARWWKRGGYEDVFRLDLDGMIFPLGTNLCSSLWVYTWGMAGARLADASNRIAATGVPMSAVPFASQFWSAALPDGARRLTWQDFALNRDTNTPVSSQLDLYPSGDFVARSNLVETVYRRVNPDDWDDDGYPNGIDPNPYAFDEGGFGPHQELPQGANSNAYCWVDIVVPNANALVTFVGDAPCALPDPSFIARAGETNRVTVLIGKTYTVTCNMPISCVDKSSVDIDVWQNSPTELCICWPVTIESVGMRSGASFSMSVWPGCLGGGFTWTNSCCSISGSGWTFTYSCNDACHCTGCAAMGYYSYESYRLPAYGGWCGCSSYGEYDERPYEEDDEGPYDAGASAVFSKSAVIFEDGYWNTPTNWVERQSTQTELHCVAHGGPNGGHVRFEILGEDKLERVSGHVLPVEQDVGPGKKIDFTIVYKGRLPSTAAEDIIVTTTFTENVPDATQEQDEEKLTSVKVELEAVYVAPANTNQNRHVYGVGEKVKLRHFPVGARLSWSLGADDFFSDLLDGDGCDNILQLHFLGGTISDVVASCYGESYHPPISVMEPQAIVCNQQVWNNECRPKGQAGGFGMRLWLYIGPMNVSFQGIDVSEIPCETVLQPSGYYATTNFDGVLVHNLDAGAGYWHHVSVGNYWCMDDAGSNDRRQVWSNGTMTWNIPIQWYQRLDATESWARGSVHSDGRLIGGSENAYQQVFEITESGTVKVAKHQHWIERTTNDVIRLDGVTVHDGNH